MKQSLTIYNDESLDHTILAIDRR